jgi:hypothetical protein
VLLWTGIKTCFGGSRSVIGFCASNVPYSDKPTGKNVFVNLIDHL